MNVTQILTDLAHDVHWQRSTLTPPEKADVMHAVCLYPELKKQTLHGFGGAFTEAAGYNWLKLDADRREAFAAACYGPTGLDYTLGRTHMGSCDFGLGNYAAVQDAADTGFAMDHDETYIMPLLRAAQAVAGDPIGLLLSPWSPPAFMKSNGEMNHGGTLLPQYRAAWAELVAGYVSRYRAAGFDVRQVSIQNEPEAVQTWDSCIWTAEEEGAFAAEFLRPALDKAGMNDVKILIWDHNKESLLRRAAGSFAKPEWRDAIDGIAFHWYTGDHFDAVGLAGELWPEKELCFTEGCVEYSRFAESGEVRKAEMYAHDMMGNLNAGTVEIIDWNLLLDEAGGPNHVGNFCAAPLMLDGAGGFARQGTYWYIGQFSRYLRPGAVRIATSRWCAELEVTAFENTDGSIAAVLLNRSETAQPASILLGDQAPAALEVPAHSIITLLLEQ